jgi:hypothetical protein
MSARVKSDLVTRQQQIETSLLKGGAVFSNLERPKTELVMSILHGMQTAVVEPHA